MSGGPLQWFPDRGLVPVGSAAPALTLVEPPVNDDDDADEDDAPQPKRTAPRRKAEPSPANIISLAKRRLRDVERELARLRKLEVERDELRRLIAAARPRKG